MKKNYSKGHIQARGNRSQIHSPLLADKVDLGCHTGPPAVAWRADTTTLYAIVNFIPSVRDFEFGLWKLKGMNDEANCEMQ